MRQVRLGRTGFEISELGMGGIPITRLGLEEAVGLIAHCFEQGITFFDTANVYGDSEIKMGAALADVRDRVVLATKTICRDRAGAEAQLEQSLRQLRTDRIDLYQLHNISTSEILAEVTAPAGACEALAEARRAGRIRAIGFSSHNLETAAAACRTGLFETVQVPFNFIESDPAEKLFPAARAQDMGIIAMKPLGGGLLGRADLCFAFLQQHPEVVPIPGVESRAEVDEILECYRTRRPLDQAARAEIETLRAEMGPRFCHRCGYCQPCPQGIDIWRVLLFKPQTRRFPPEMALRMSGQAMEAAEQCERCGECQERCPYDLPVPDLIAESLDYFREFCRNHEAGNRPNR